MHFCDLIWHNNPAMIISFLGKVQYPFRNVDNMQELKQELIKRVRDVSEINITSLTLLAENNYCLIFRADTDNEPLIVKKYKTVDNKLAVLEAGGVNTYHRITASNPDFIDSSAMFVDEEMKLVGVSFVKGRCMADIIYEKAKRPEEWRYISNLAEKLGNFLRMAREISIQQNADFTPFHREYISYCSKKLQELPLVGQMFFQNLEKSAHEMTERLISSTEKPSFAHGDFVFRNIHVDGDHIGLIDFANCLDCSHTLNDAFNLWFALQNMIIPQGLKVQIWQAFVKGLGQTASAGPVVHFFYEYHRRRWLMLNLGSRDPRRWLRALYGMTTFARNFSKVRKQFKL